MSEQELVTLIAEKPSEGISAVMDLYGGAILKICRDILRGCSEEDVEEAVADTFAALWEAMVNGRYTGQAQIRYYLYGIARRTACGKLRSEKNRPLQEDVEELQLAGGDYVEDRAIKRSECELVHALIHSMKSPDKEIFYYRYYEDMQVKEIAQKCSLSTKKVENVLFRGKAALRKQLLAWGY